MSQIDQWGGLFGKEYTDRNDMTLEGLELLCEGQYGLTRTEMNQGFIGELDRNINILEVGANIGNQLLCLQEAGFKNLHGIELQPYAVELSKRRTRNIDIIEGSAFDLPYEGGAFDLVFTSGLLIHIDPKDIMRVMGEMYRCTKKYIWGFEYYSDAYTPIEYRGHSDLLWKADFAQLFLRRFNNLTLAKEERFKYLDNDNVDTMFLLRKNES